MPSERVQRQKDRLLDEAEQGIKDGNWTLVGTRAQDALALDAGNADALTYLAAAESRLHGAAGAIHRAPTPAEGAAVDPGSLGARHASPRVPSGARHTEALAHLDFAIGEFREMKM